MTNDSSRVESDRCAPERRRARAGLTILLVLVAGLHATWIWRVPSPNLFGDEGHYLGFANRDSRAGTTGLLPGQLRFDRRPELGSRLYAQLAGPSVRNEALIRRIGVLQLAMLLALLAAVYRLARVLGLRAFGTINACALLGLFPWFGFYVHGIWPEIPHALFVSLSLLCLAEYLRALQPAWLIPAAAALAYALFTKGSASALAPVVAAFLFVATYRALPELSRPRRGLRAAFASALFLAVLAAFVAPQLVRNADDGHGWRLGANRWDALEAGIRIAHPDYDDPHPPLGRRMSVGREYLEAGSTWDERERRARERTLAHIASTPPIELIGEQTRKLAWCLFRSRAFFEQSIGFRKRWGDPAPAALVSLRQPARILWYAILVLGTVGLGATALRSSGWFLLALFVIYFLGGLFLVPLKLRYAMPLVPPLCILSGAALEWAQRSLLARRIAADATRDSPAGKTPR
jgi:hypothetical protein